MDGVMLLSYNSTSPHILRTTRLDPTSTIYPPSLLFCFVTLAMLA